MVDACDQVPPYYFSHLTFFVLFLTFPPSYTSIDSNIGLSIEGLEVCSFSRVPNLQKTEA